MVHRVFHWKTSLWFWGSKQLGIIKSSDWGAKCTYAKVGNLVCKNKLWNGYFNGDITKV